MTMKKLIYTNKKGGVSVVIPCPKEDIERVLGPMTQEEYEAHVIERSIPKGTKFEKLEDDSVLEDRVFRDAWKKYGTKIQIDRDKARTIIRQERNRSLEKLDKKAITESRKPDGDLDKINTRAQELRDLPTQSKFNSNNVEDLKEMLEKAKENE